MAELVVPFFSEATGWTVDIDGVTYRPPVVDSSGRLLAMVVALDGSTERRLIADPDGRLIVTLDRDGDDPRLANENYSTAQTNNELIAAPGSGLRIYVTGIFYSTDTGMNMKLTQSSGSPADVFGPHYFPDDGGISAPTLSVPLRLNDNSALRVTTSAAGNCSITVLAKVE